MRRLADPHKAWRVRVPAKVGECPEQSLTNMTIKRVPVRRTNVNTRSVWWNVGSDTATPLTGAIPCKREAVLTTSPAT
jgi:hypothetical protein